MKNRKTTIVTVVAFTLVAVFALAGVSSAQTTLNGRHQIGLNAGGWNQTTDARVEIQAGFVTTTVENSGAYGGIFYGHWLAENQVVFVSLGSMIADVQVVSGMFEVATERAMVTPILLGMKFYPLKSSLTSSVRPHIGAAVGPFIGNQNVEVVGVVITSLERTELAIGGQLSAGIDFALSRRFMLGATAGVNIHSDFKEPIGGSTNYSGPSFTIDFSVLFGKGKK